MSRGLPTINDAIRVGRASSVDVETNTVRVEFFDRSKTVSYNLPILQRNTLKNRDYAVFDPGEHVLCIFLDNGLQQGFVLGAIYDKKNPPFRHPPLDEHIRQVEFEDGTLIRYDRDAHELTIDCVGDVHIRGRRVYTHEYAR